MPACVGGMPVVGSSSVRLHLSVHLLVHCNTFRVCFEQPGVFLSVCVILCFNGFILDNMGNDH